MGGTRLHYIDWLRVLAVLLLFPFHAGRVFNAGGTFYAKSPVQSEFIGLFLWFVDYWHMPLLFFLAGVSTVYALRRRTLGQYARERTQRLGIPLLFGILVIVPPQTWYGARTNAGYAESFGHYLVSGDFLSFDNLFGRGDYFGGISPGHLWFVMFLWIMSILALPLLAWAKRPRGATRASTYAEKTARPRWWLAIVLLLMLTEALPAIADKNLFYYFTYFALGWLCYQVTSFSQTAEKTRAVTLGVGVAIVGLTMMSTNYRDALPDPSWARIALTYGALAGVWLTLTGLLGMGRRHLDAPSAALSYLAEASYPLYILHQTVIVAVGFYLVQLVPAPGVGWPLLTVVSVVATFGIYEVVRRVGALRWLFGMRPQRS